MPTNGVSNAYYTPIEGISNTMTRHLHENSQIKFGILLTYSYLCIVILKRVARKGSLSRD